MLEFRLPDVGEGLDEAEVVRWLVAAGDDVQRDQPIVEIQTDKALVEIPSPAKGRVASLEVGEGTVVKVGDLLFTLENGTGAKAPGSGSPKPAAPADSQAATRGTEPSPEARAARPAVSRRPKAAPTVRKLALERGVDLAAVSGSGPGGRILAADVEAAAAGAAPSPSAPRSVALGGSDTEAVTPGLQPGVHPLRGMRRAIARNMATSWSSIPHIHTFDEVDATRLLAVRRRIKDAAASAGGASPTPLAFFVMACARALRRHPMVNASIDMEKEQIHVHERVNIGLAVATGDGLLVPVLQDADRKPLAVIAAEVETLGKAARARRLRPEQMRDGTFTISNFGSLGGRFAAPIIRHPEAAIMGFGEIRQRPTAEDGAVVVRPLLPVCLGADHRLIDGDLAESFKRTVIEALVDPVQLLVP